MSEEEARCAKAGQCDCVYGPCKVGYHHCGIHGNGCHVYCGG